MSYSKKELIKYHFNCSQILFLKYKEPLPYCWFYWTLGYQLLYLSARSVVQAGPTRDYLRYRLAPPETISGTGWPHQGLSQVQADPIRDYRRNMSRVPICTLLYYQFFLSSL